MKSFNALKSPFISILDHIKSSNLKPFLLFVAVILSIIGAPNYALAQTPLPLFGDPRLQECFDEQAAANGWVFAEDVTALICQNRGIQDIYGLEQLVNLNTLDLSGNNIKDIYPAAYGINGPLPIKELRLGDNNITDMQPLQAFNGLEVLWLSGNTGIDWNLLKPIINQNPNLTQLGLGGIHFNTPHIPDFYPLADQITALDISNTGIEGIWGLEQYSSLVKLDASDNKIEDIHPVVYGVNGPLPIRELRLGNNRITDIQPLQAFNGLRVLWLSGNAGIEWNLLKPIIDQNSGLIELGLGGINFNTPLIPSFSFPVNQIAALDISNTGIEGLWGLEQYSNLERLDASDNKIEDIHPAVYGVNGPLPIRELRLGNNRITDIQPLGAFNGLEVLWLSDNAGIEWNLLKPIIDQNSGLIELGLGSINFNQPDVPWLSIPVDQIIALDISNTGIEGLWELKQYSSLERLDASDNNIEDIFPIMYGPNGPLPIKELRLGNNRITDIQPLQAFNGLRVLWLSGNAGIEWNQLEPIVNQNQNLQRLGFGGINFNSPIVPSFSFSVEQITALDVSNTGIWDLPNLSQFSRLQSLDASDNHINYLGPLVGSNGPLPLKELRLGNNRITDVQPLQALYELEVLWLSGNTDIDWNQLQSIISQNHNLQQLGLGGINFNTPYIPLSLPVEQITALDVSNTGIWDLPNLSQYSRLQSLDASDNQINYLGPLVGSNGPLPLKELHLGNNRITDVQPLQALYELEVLWLSDNTGIEWNQLQSIIDQNQNLQQLGLGGINFNRPTVPSFSFPVDQIVALDVSNTGITYLDGLEQYSNLERLDASNNNIFNIYPLLDYNGPLPIKELRLGNNNITDVYPLQFFYELKVLWLSGNTSIDWNLLKPIIDQNSELTHLGLGSINFNSPTIPDFNSPLNQISTLDVSNTGIEWLGGLEQYTHLDTLDASNNSLMDIISLLLLQNIRAVDLHGNLYIPCDQLDQLEGMASIESVVRPATCAIGYAPDIMIQFPIDGIETIEGLTETLTGSAYDFEDGDLSASISWSSSLSGLLGTGTPLDVQFVPGVQTITASITDSNGNTRSQSVQIEVIPNEAPVVSIAPPLPDSIVMEGNSIIFVGDATDTEDGNLSTAIIWSSNLDGTLGSGAFIEHQLSVGAHTITATVSDSLGKTTSASVAVTIELNNTPTLDIMSPATPVTLFEGIDLALQAVANDVEDGDLTAAIAWSSNLDGALGSGGNVIQQLSIGVHTITATVNDSLGKTTSASVAVTIELNNAPTLDILSPATPVTLFEGIDLALQAAASDVEDGDLTAAITWSSNLDGALGSGGNVIQQLSIGVHTITATVSDSLSKTTSASVTVTVEINNAPTVQILNPATPVTFFEDTSLTLQAVANDVEDGNLSSSIVWHSSSIGELGTGANITVTLPIGVHAISATINDSIGKTTVAATQVTVEFNNPPTINITSPSDGLIVEDGLSVTLIANSSDIEDGSLASSIEWHSSISGYLGTGNNLSVQLPLGNHNIEATATDSNGKSANTTSAISISPAPLLSYCAADGKSASREWIDQISIAGETFTSHSQGGYGDFWGLGPVYLSRGSNTITLTPGFSRNARTENWRVWIDLNRDGVFADNELLLSASESGTVNGSITIPTNAITGNTRLRIAMRSRGWPSSCGTFRRGEVEDYRVILQP